MDKTVTELIDPILLEAINSLSEQDDVIANCLKKSDTIEMFVNSLIATIVCISTRELENLEKIETLMKNNTGVQKILELNKREC